jgi:hypothetical protein
MPSSSFSLDFPDVFAVIIHRYNFGKCPSFKPHIGEMGEEDS